MACTALPRLTQYLVALAWILLFGAPLAAGAIAGWRCHVPDDPAEASAARAWQGFAAGLVSGGVGALSVTVLGTGTTALMVKSAWVRGCAVPRAAPDRHRGLRP